MAETAIQLLRDLRAEIGEDRRIAKADRAALYAQIDSLAAVIAQMRTDIAVSATIDAQIRDRINSLDINVNARIDHLETKVEANRLDAAPTIEAWRDLLKTGTFFGRAFSIAGITTATALFGALTGLWEWLFNAGKAMIAWFAKLL